MDKDLEFLQGSWSVTALEVDGETMSGPMLESARIVVKGDRFTSAGMEAVYQGVLSLDPSASPPRLDMRFEAGPENGATNLGIYEISGQTWRLCLATRGDVRPSAFATKPGSGFALETLSRAPAKGKVPSVKRAASPPPDDAPATEIEGEWSMVAGVMNGVPMDPSLFRWVKRVNHGNRSTVTAGPQTMLNVEFTLDSSQSPRAIDYLNLAGSLKGKSQSGIYKLEGGVLTICVSAPGDPRPVEFQSAAGSNQTLTGWKRA